MPPKKPTTPPTPKVKPPKGGTPSQTWGVPLAQVLQGIPGIDPKKVADDAALDQWLMQNTNITANDLLDFKTDSNSGVARLQAFVNDPQNLKNPGGQQPQNVAGASTDTDATSRTPFKPSTARTHGQLVNNLRGQPLRPGTREKVVIEEGPSGRTTTIKRKRSNAVADATGAGAGSGAGAGTQAGGSAQTGGGSGGSNANPTPKTLPPLMDEIRAARQSYIDAGRVPPFTAGIGPIVNRYGPQAAAIAGTVLGLGATGLGIGYGMRGGSAPPQQGQPPVDPRAQELLRRKQQMMDPTPQQPPSNPAGGPQPTNTTLMQLQRLMNSREYA